MAVRATDRKSKVAASLKIYFRFFSWNKRQIDFKLGNVKKHQSDLEINKRCQKTTQLAGKGWSDKKTIFK